MIDRIKYTLAHLARRWRRDDRGSSMLTTALTLPFLIIFLAAVWYLFLFMAVKQSLHIGVIDATRYLSEDGRYWNIDPTLQASPENAIFEENLFPIDYWDREAKRVVVNRLSTFLLPPGLVTESLFVTVTEPLLALSPERTSEPLDLGASANLCNPAANNEGDYRDWRNVRFMVYATYKVPLWSPSVPYIGSWDVTLHERAVGYLQCPRWTGMEKAGTPAVDYWLAREGPYLAYRTALTPVPAAKVFPTVTVRPTDFPTWTPTLTPTDTPSVTDTPSITDTPVPPTQTSAPPP